MTYTQKTVLAAVAAVLASAALGQASAGDLVANPETVFAKGLKWIDKPRGEQRRPPTESPWQRAHQLEWHNLSGTVGEGRRISRQDDLGDWRAAGKCLVAARNR